MIARVGVCGLLLACLLTACATRPTSAGVDCVSASDLLSRAATGEEEVVVCGYLHYRFEDHSLYPTKSEARRQGQSCFGLGVQESLVKSLETLDDSKVRLTGTLLSLACPEGALCMSQCTGPTLLVRDAAEL